MLKAEQEWVQEEVERAVRQAVRPLKARIDKLEKARMPTPTRKTEVKNAKL